ncbi:dihydroxyacetone kinase [Ktedonobacteria bacterium brp13]|nr:dihydroxyacetone kinase [Ktedonobacteria bacterium brp13]
MEEKTSRSKLRPRPRRISVFDGQDLGKAMLAAAAWLEENREMINTLNVFPVPDGDTGSNMAATMRSAIRNIPDSDEKSASVIATRIAHDALLGARGNSGVILSQTLRGLAAGLKDKQTFTAPDLAEAFEQASQLAYRAVIKPVEGTILTVVRESAEAARKSANNNDDLVGLMTTVVAAARKAVAHTPELLPTLKQAGVVDAGGQGFCTILEGILRYMRGERAVAELANVEAPVAETPLAAHHKKGRITVEEEFGYEVVFLLRGEDLDVEGIRQTIIDMGGVSTVVAGDETMLKVHTHTATPGKVLDYGVSLGSLLDINIENLQEQSLTYAAESAAEHADEVQVDETTQSDAQPKIATVAVVSGPGFEKVFSGLGVSAIISGGQTMNPSIEELLDAVEKTVARQVIILPNNSNVILSAQQVVDLTEKEICVIPCKTLPQGIAAMISINYEADFSTNCEMMTRAATSIQTAEITTAVRSVQLGGLHVREGDYIGVINGNLAVASQQIEDVMRDTLRRLTIDDYEILTIYYGQDITEEQAHKTAGWIKKQYSQLEIEVVNGGQPYYAFILSME